MKEFNEAGISKINADKNNDNKTEEVKTEKTHNEAKGFSYFREQPGYAADHKGGYDKYDAMLELQKETEKNLSNPEVAEAHEKIKQAVEEKSRASLLGKVRDIASSNAFRAAFLSVMLFAKVGQASAENFNSNRLPGQKIELSKDDETREKFAEGNYVASNNEFLKIKASNYFETDKAEISPEEAKEIKENFHEFISGINDKNFQDVISKEWVVKGSSDERETKNWGGSNENLTLARIDALQKILKEAALEHGFDYRKNLSPEQIATIKNKEIKISYPRGREGKENGVTYITDKINPETGEKYTETEVAEMKKNDKEEYYKLLESCRFTNFETESGFFSEIENFDQVHFLIDESGSMSASKFFISNHLRSLGIDKKINLNLYSEQANAESIQCVSSEEAADKILNLNTEGSFRERQINSALDLINRISSEKAAKGEAAKEEKHKVYVATDEAIQNTNSVILNLLQYKAKEVNADVEFLIGYKEWIGSKDNGYEKGRVAKLSLDDLAKKAKEIEEKETKEGVKKDIKSEKIDIFYERNYQEKRGGFMNYLRDYKGAEFKNLLQSKGYGESVGEITDRLVEELSGPGNYAKLNDIINIKKIENAYISKMSGNGGDSKLAESVFSSARALREMIEAKNERDLVVEAVKDIPSDSIPDIKDNFFIKEIKNIAPVDIPAVGPTDLASNLYYSFSQK